MSRIVFYLFILAVLLIIVGYYAGANQLAKTGFSGINQLGLTFTGRNSNGQYASYPSNAPTA